MKEKFLPLGSIVKLIGGTKELMITGYCQEIKSKPDKVYDYRGCPYPEGVLDSKISVLFDIEQIDKVIYEGLRDAESLDFIDKLEIATEE
jgi:hypothetical protein